MKPRSNNYQVSTILLSFIISIFMSCSPSKAVQTSEKVRKCDIHDEIDEFKKTRSIYTPIFLFYKEDINLKKSRLNDINYVENSGYKETQLRLYFGVRWVDGQKKGIIQREVYQISRYLQSPSNYELMIILENNEVISIPNVEASTLPSLEDGGWVVQYHEFEFNENIWSQLIESPIKKIRFQCYVYDNFTRVFNNDITISPELSDVIPFSVKCVDDYLKTINED